MGDTDRDIGASEEHLTAAENWLVVAEAIRTELAETDPTDDPFPPGVTYRETRIRDSSGTLLSSAIDLANAHREMAQAYWSAPRTLASVDADGVTEGDPLAGINGPAENALLKASAKIAAVGWMQVAEWLAECANANREGTAWPPLIAAPGSVAGTGRVFAAELHGKGPARFESTVREFGDDGLEDMRTAVKREQNRRRYGR